MMCLLPSFLKTYNALQCPHSPGHPLFLGFPWRIVNSLMMIPSQQKTDAPLPHSFMYSHRSVNQHGNSYIGLHV